MSVLVQKSVGDIIYQLIDDLYPVHSGKTGYVAITKSGDIFTCDNGYIWSTYNQKNLSSEIYSFNHNDTNLAPTLDTWFIPGIGGTTPFLASTNSSGFTTTGLNTNDARVLLNFDNVGRFLAISSNTLRADNTRWAQVDWAPSKNANNPSRFNTAHFGTSAQNDATNIFTPVLFNLDSRLGDYMYMAYRVSSRESNTAYFDRLHNKLSIGLIEQPIIFNEKANTLSFDTNDWVTVNDTTNKWVMGSAITFSGGGTSIYVSNDNGTTNAYTNNVAQVSHFYKDITFPSNLQSDVTLSFYWRCSGEVGADFSNIYLAPNIVTPVAGTQVSSTYRIGLSQYNNNATFQLATITIPRESVVNQTKRLIFSWINNASVGTNPPMVVDSLRLHFYVNDDRYQLVTGNTETFSYLGFSGNSWTVANGATNQWIVGTSEFSGSSDNYSAYITNASNLTYYGEEFNNADNKGLAQYTINVTQVSHFYKDFTLTSASTLTFNWKCWGENGIFAANYDYGAVVITTTATVPAAGTEVSTAQAPAGGNGRIGATTNAGKFNLGYGGPDNNWRTETINLSAYAGQTKRIVFTWKNDGSVGNNPGFVVDNIRITGIGNWAVAVQKIN